MSVQTSARQRRVSHRTRQLTLPGIDPSPTLTTWQQASSVVGEFFELLTAKFVDGDRCAIDSAAGHNPDVVTASRVFESKAACRDRWLIAERQHDAFLQVPNGYYALWSYRAAAGSLTVHETEAGLRQWLGQAVTACYVMPATYPQLILAGTPHAEPRASNALWGSNYWFRARYLHEVLGRKRVIPAHYRVHRRTLGIREIHGVPVAAIPVFWFTPMDDRAITDLDVQFATTALQDLAEKRHEVVLIPCETGPGKKRVVTNQNPEWYCIFIHRREKPPKKWRGRNRWVQPKNAQTRGGYRPLVKKALLRIMNRRPNPQRTWIGWELMEILRDQHEEETRREYAEP